MHAGRAASGTQTIGKVLFICRCVAFIKRRAYMQTQRAAERELEAWRASCVTEGEKTMMRRPAALSAHVPLQTCTPGVVPHLTKGCHLARLVCSGLAAREMQPIGGSAGVASSGHGVSKGVYAASRSSCLKPGTREASQSGAGREGWRLAVEICHGIPNLS